MNCPIKKLTFSETTLSLLLACIYTKNKTKSVPSLTLRPPLLLAREPDNKAAAIISVRKDESFYASETSQRSQRRRGTGSKDG